jgi:septum formation protein
MGKNQSLKMPYPLILASTSKYRGILLAQLGHTFEAINPNVDEDEVKNGRLLPEEIALHLSHSKAQAVYNRRPDACVIGSDQVCALDGEIFGKPHTTEKATEQIYKMQGKRHELLTAVTIIYPGGTETFLNRTILHMRALGLNEIKSYVEDDRPLDCAGSYKLESKGIKLFEKIEMNDHTAIIGLPLIELTTRLLKLGYPL